MLHFCKTTPWVLLLNLILWTSTSYAANIFAEDFDGTDEEKVMDAIDAAEPGDTVFFGAFCKEHQFGSHKIGSCLFPKTWHITRQIYAKNGVNYTGYTKYGRSTLKHNPTGQWYTKDRSARLLAFNKSLVSVHTTTVRHLNFDMNRDAQVFNWIQCNKDSDCNGQTCASYEGAFNVCIPIRADDEDEFEAKQIGLFASAITTKAHPTQDFLLEHLSFENSTWQGFNVWHHAQVTASNITTSNNHNAVAVGGHEGHISLDLDQWTSTLDRVGFRAEIEGLQGDNNNTILLCLKKNKFLNCNKCDDDGLNCAPHIVGLPHGASSRSDRAISTATINITNSTITDAIQRGVNMSVKGGDGVGSSFSIANLTSSCSSGNSNQCRPDVFIRPSYATVQLTDVNIDANEHHVALELKDVGNDVDIVDSVFGGSIIVIPMYRRYADGYLDQNGFEHNIWYNTLGAQVYMDNVRFDGPLASLSTILGDTNNACVRLPLSLVASGQDTVALLGCLDRINMGGITQYKLYDIQFNPQHLPDYILSTHGGDISLDLATRLNAGNPPMLVSGSNIASNAGSSTAHETNVRWERITCLHPLCVPTQRWMEQNFSTGVFSIFDPTVYDFRH